MEIKDNLARVQVIQEQRRGMVFGELENDNEDINNAIKDIHSQLRQSFSKMDSITGQVQDTSSAINRIGDALLAQQDQLTDLRNSLQNGLRAPAPVIIHAPTPAPAPAPAPAPVVAPSAAPAPKPVPQHVSLPKESVSLSSSSWNHILLNSTKPAAASAALEANPAPVASTIQVMEFSPPVKERPAPAQPPAEVKPAPVPKPEPVVEPKPAVVEAKPAPPKEVAVTFSMEQNADLRAMNVVKVVVTLDTSLPADELIFTIRKTAANKVALAFSSVSLLLENRVIKLGVDVPKSVPFTALDIQRYAASGRLQLKLQRPKMVSDAQIDSLLLPAWESESTTKRVPSAAKTGRGAAALDATADSKGMDEVEPGSATVKKALDGFNTLRMSLDGMLRELNERGGLTDDEMAAKKAEIESYSSQSETEDFR